MTSFPFRFQLFVSDVLWCFMEFQKIRSVEVRSVVRTNLIWLLFVTCSSVIHESLTKVKNGSEMSSIKIVFIKTTLKTSPQINVHLLESIESSLLINSFFTLSFRNYSDKITSNCREGRRVENNRQQGSTEHMLLNIIRANAKCQ